MSREARFGILVGIVLGLLYAYAITLAFAPRVSGAPSPTQESRK